MAMVDISASNTGYAISKQCYSQSSGTEASSAAAVHKRAGSTCCIRQTYAISSAEPGSAAATCWDNDLIYTFGSHQLT